MVKAELKSRDNVKNARGTHKKNKHGIYEGPWGSVMARVKVEGATREERHLLLTCIQKKGIKADTKQDTKTFATATAITVERNTPEMLSEELMPPKIAVKGMEDEIKSPCCWSFRCFLLRGSPG